MKNDEYKYLEVAFNVEQFSKKHKFLIEQYKTQINLMVLEFSSNLNKIIAENNATVFILKNLNIAIISEENMIPKFISRLTYHLK